MPSENKDPVGLSVQKTFTSCRGGGEDSLKDRVQG